MKRIDDLGVSGGGGGERLGPISGEAEDLPILEVFGDGGVYILRSAGAGGDDDKLDLFEDCRCNGGCADWSAGTSIVPVCFKCCTTVGDQHRRHENAQNRANTPSCFMRSVSSAISSGLTVA